jgi:hypothetical protein
MNLDESDKLTNLEGAVNDAKLLMEALREIPNKRVLLDADAIRSAFLDA